GRHRRRPGRPAAVQRRLGLGIDRLVRRAGALAPAAAGARHLPRDQRGGRGGGAGRRRRARPDRPGPGRDHDLRDGGASADPAAGGAGAGGDRPAGRGGRRSRERGPAPAAGRRAAARRPPAALPHRPRRGRPAAGRARRRHPRPGRPRGAAPLRGRGRPAAPAVRRDRRRRRPAAARAARLQLHRRPARRGRGPAADRPAAGAGPGRPPGADRGAAAGAGRRRAASPGDRARPERRGGGQRPGRRAGAGAGRSGGHGKLDGDGERAGRGRPALGGGAMAEVSVVLVDDHPVVHDGVRAWLEQDPQRRIELVAAGDDVEVAWTAPGLTADVVLLDLNLHGTMAVPEVSRFADAGRRVVVYSEHSDDATVLAVMERGAYAFLAKQEARDHCVATILAAATDRPYVAPLAAGTMAADERPDRPALSDRERTALLLWFQSMSKAAVATRMGIAETTVRQYIQRARIKYANAGRPAATRTQLLARAIQDGLIRADEVTEYASRASRTT